MKYYIGFYNKFPDEFEFTVICSAYLRGAADFILESYQEAEKRGHPDRERSIYVLLTAAEIMNKELYF